MQQGGGSPPHRRADKARSFLLSSRTNSRPQLPRYAVSSASLHELQQPGAGSCPGKSEEDEEGGGGTAPEKRFGQRRAQLLEELMEMERGCVAGTTRDESEDSGRQSSRAESVVEEQLSRDSLSVLGSYTEGYATVDLPPKEGNYGTPLGGGFGESEGRGAIELSRLEQFHRFLEELSNQKGDHLSNSERIHKYEQLTGVVENFLHEAECYGKVILQEIGKPLSEKTIRPLHNTGVLGGEKFNHAGIYFKLAVDKSGLLGGFDGARKVARHEIKSLAALMNANVSELLFPLVCLVTYCGLSIIAMTQLPINAASLVYGSSDAGRTLHFGHPKALELCSELGKRLNLRGHRPKRSDTVIYTPVDMEVHEAEGGRFYALDFSRLFPPTVPRKDIAGSQFQQLFRPEFVAKGAPLCSDAFSNFLDASERTVIEGEIMEAMKRLEALIEQFAADVSVRPIPARLGNDREYAMQVIVILLHSRGINCRYLGQIRTQCTSEYWRLQILINMIMRRLKRRLMAQMRNFHLGNCGISTIMQNTVEFFNLVFGASDASTAFWQDFVLCDVQEYFGPQSDLAGVRGFKSHLMGQPHIEESVAFRLFWELTKKAALNWGTLTDYYRSQPHLLTLSRAPFDFGDLKELPVEVTHLPILLHAQAKIKQILAMRCSGSRAFFLNWTSVSYFVRALDVLTTKEILRNIASSLGLIGANAAAREYFDMALSMDPHDERTLFKLANFCDASYQLDDAEEHYLASLECCTGVPSVHRLCTYADFLLTGRRLSKAAVACYEACLHLCPTHGEAAHNLALVLSRSHPARAAELFELAIRHCCDPTGHARAVRSAAAFFEEIGNCQRAEKLLEQAKNFEFVVSSAPLLHHATCSDTEFSEIAAILGPARKFKISQLRLSLPVSGAESMSLEELARTKVRQIYARFSYPVSTEVVYIAVGDRVVIGHEFDAIGATDFVRQFGEGSACRVGVVVAFTSNGHDVCVTAGSTAGTLVAAAPHASKKAFGWDAIFRIDEFGLTLSDISDANLKDYISFRRLPYLKLWLLNFPNE